MRKRRLGPVQELVLQAVAGGHRYGFDLMDVTGLASGAVYQALAALERAGYVSSRWERPQVAERDKRPRRRYYAMTRTGTRVLAETAERHRTFRRAMPRATSNRDPGYETR